MEVDAGSGLPAQQIVEDAHLALGCPYVALNLFDAANGTTRTLAVGGAHLPGIQRALRLARRMLPDVDPILVTARADVNEVTRAVYLQNRTVSAPLEDVARGVVPPVLVRIGLHVAGIAHCLMVPLHVDGRVLGSLACAQQSATFTESQVRVARVFASQVSLAMRNAELLAEQRRISAALAESRRLITEAEERTRREISDFLHSRVQSRLLVAWYRLGEVRGVPEEAARQIAAVRDDLDDLRERDVRQVSHLLHPEALRVGLIAALQVLASRLSGVVDVQIHACDRTLTLDDPVRNRLPMALRLVVFRTVDEAVTNALKHARASRVKIALSMAGRDRLRVEVSDDGVGFDAGLVPPGLGLLCIAARIEHARGGWGIDSRPGGPTCLWAEVPLCES